jgi:hypothetical protein
MLTLGLLDMALYAAALGQLATLDEAAELGVEAFDSGDFDVGTENFREERPRAS